MSGTHRKKRSLKSGLPPGSLLYTGKESGLAARISVMSFREDGFTEDRDLTSESFEKIRRLSGVIWLNVEGVHQAHLIEKIGLLFGFHPLVMEDILNTNQRAKIEDYGEYLFMVLNTFQPGETGKHIKEQISLILGGNFVISFQETVNGDLFRPVQERIRSAKGRIRGMGADYLAYSLLDVIVDGYFGVLERFEDRISVLEEESEQNPTKEMLSGIYQLRREMILMRKSVWHLRDVFSYLERGDFALIKSTTRIYIRDVYDHIVQIIDIIETYREMLSGIHEIYLSSISKKTGEIMKVLTIMGTIFMPLTFIVGIYGMNFRHMPELEWEWGYYSVMVFMLFLSGFMVWYFKKKEWL